jgi:putative holliday junction resolvase
MKGRAIGLDVGTKTIGVAFSDPLGIAAHPHSTLSRQGVRRDCDALMALVEAKGGVEHVIVGMPFELDGTEERMARLARQIGVELGGRLDITPVYIDERFSSVEAEEALLRLDLSRKKRKQVIDQAAAILILQSWLDHGDWTGAG